MTRSRRLLNTALAVSVLGLAAAAAGAGYLAWRMLNPPGYSDAGSAAFAGLGADFSLSNQHGGVTRLSDLRGDVVMMFFGYTHCPDICPATLFTMAQARKLLGADGERFQGVFITVDPERDTPERLREYVGFFDPDFLALTGSEQDLTQVARDFGAAFEKGEKTADGGYLMGHTTFGYLIGPDGKVARLLPSTAPPEEIAKAARDALAG
jgi:protein SCO1/2